MEFDEEGFLYPVVNKKNCKHCGLCEKVCPYTVLTKEENCSTCVAIQNKNDNRRNISTAGGAFSLIADYILQHNGIVYAVGYSEMVVCHKKCTEQDQLRELCGSKYVQSTLNETFKEIKTHLKIGKFVLFVGTPCQAHGLKRYIGESPNLIIIDLLCLGTSSPGLFSKWIDYLNQKYDSKVSYVRFRDKSYGYAVPNIRVQFSNGKIIEQSYDAKVHSNMFFKHFYDVRPSCYQCVYREKPRVSDFTIGDCVNIGQFNKTMDDNKGTTRMWIHTERGMQIFKELTFQMRVTSIINTCNNICGGGNQIPLPPDRREFFNDSIRLSYAQLIKLYEPNSLKKMGINMFRRIINHLPRVISTHISKGLRLKQAKRSDMRVELATRVQKEMKNEFD